MRICVLLCMFANLALSAENTYQWIQYLPNNHLAARAIVESSACPDINIDGKINKMNFRGNYSDSRIAKKITICEYDVTGADSVHINKIALKLPPKHVNRFVVVGDSGCESSIFSKNHHHQECSGSTWPFKEIADRIAQLQPDLTVHLGDYVYKNKHSNEEHAKENEHVQWSMFKEEFFDPANNLLRNVPMLFIRGNHESCASMGRGWFLFLDPYRYSFTCSEYTEPYILQINDLNFAVFDSSAAARADQYKETQLNRFKDDFIKIYKKLSRPAWVLIHHPILGINKLSETESVDYRVNCPVINRAFGYDLVKKMPLAISGHFHLTADISREQDGFKQFIFGNSGTRLNPSSEQSFNYNVDGNNLKAKVNFGYALFERINGIKWKVTSFAIDGTVLFEDEILSNIP